MLVLYLKSLKERDYERYRKLVSVLRGLGFPESITGSVTPSYEDINSLLDRRTADWILSFLPEFERPHRTERIRIEGKEFTFEFSRSYVRVSSGGKEVVIPVGVYEFSVEGLYVRARLFKAGKEIHVEGSERAFVEGLETKAGLSLNHARFLFYTLYVAGAKDELKEAECG